MVGKMVTQAELFPQILGKSSKQMTNDSPKRMSNIAFRFPGEQGPHWVCLTAPASPGATTSKDCTLMPGMGHVPLRNLTFVRATFPGSAGTNETHEEAVSQMAMPAVANHCSHQVGDINAHETTSVYSSRNANNT